jgi:outer membrane protein OmpA-like peptidoglycan-associated protein
VNKADRFGIAVLAATAALIALPVSAQTVIIDGSGVRSDGAASAYSGGTFSGLSRSGAPARTILPYNTSRGPVLAGQDTSLPPRQFSSQDRIVLRPPGQTRATASPVVKAPAPATRAPATEVVRAAPTPKAEATKPVARAEPVRPVPTPAPKPAAVEAPKAPAKAERPAIQVTKPVATARVTPAPAPAPEPAATPASKPAAAPQVAAVTPPVGAPNLSSISFDGAETDVSAAGKAALEQVAAGAKDDRNLRIQVKAYAESATETDVWKRRVSLRRAQNVRRILLDNGIESFRILVRALGAPSPDDNAPGNRVDIEVGRR